MKLLKFIVLGLTIFAFTNLTGCQTMQGLGRDIQGAGNGLQNAATR